jgi:DNA-binding Lrp family transcriptional regulator
MVTIDLDGLDNKIIGSLLADSRLSYRQIAKQLSVSAATVIARIKRLESAGIIKQYSVRLDYEKLGYDVEAVIEMRIAKGKLLEVEKKIAISNNVSAIYDVTGDTDAIVIARFPSRRQLDSFLKKIQTYDFVERTETKMILNTIKEEPIGTLGLS